MAYKDVILGHKPVAYWRLGERSGTTVIDLAATPHNGTISGSVVLGAAGALRGDPDSAIGFRGGSVNAASFLSLPVRALSWEGWYRYDGISYAAWPTLLGALNTHFFGGFRKQNTDFSNPAYYGDSVIYFEWGTAPYDGSVWTATGSIATAIQANDGKWHHLAVTYDGTTVRGYWDGVQTAASAYTGEIRTESTAYIGSSLNAGMDECAAYDYVLSPDQVNAHYQAGLTNFVPAESAAACSFHVLNGTGAFLKTLRGVLIDPIFSSKLNEGFAAIRLDFDHYPTELAYGNLIRIDFPDGTVAGIWKVEQKSADYKTETNSYSMDFVPLVAEASDVDFNANYTADTTQPNTALGIVDPSVWSTAAVARTLHLVAGTLQAVGTAYGYAFNNAVVKDAFDQHVHFGGAGWWWMVGETGIVDIRNSPPYTHSVTLGREVTETHLDEDIHSAINVQPVVGATPANGTVALSSTASDTNAGNPLSVPNLGRRVAKVFTDTSLVRQADVDAMAISLLAQQERVTYRRTAHLVGYSVRRIRCGDSMKLRIPNPDPTSGGYVTLTLMVQEVVQFGATNVYDVVLTDVVTLFAQRAQEARTNAIDKLIQNNRTAAISPDGTTGTISPVTIGNLPNTPTGLAAASFIENTAQVENAAITATWSASVVDSAHAAAASYLLRYRRTGTTPWQDAGGVIAGTLTATITGLIQGTGYDLQIAAINSGGTSAFSGTVTQTTAQAAAPAQVTQPTVSLGLTTAVVAFTLLTASDIQTYEIWQYTGASTASTPPGGSILAATGEAAIVTVGALTTNQTYTFWVRAKNWSGLFGSYSPYVQAVPNQVQTADIANAAVVTSKILDAAVITAKIADAAILATKLAPGADSIKRTPSVLVARKSVNQGGSPPATAALAGLGFTVTENLTATLAQCRSYDVIVIDCYIWGADEHNSFIQSLWRDGQKVWVAGNDSGSGAGIFYITSITGAGVIGQTQANLPRHPINTGWSTLNSDSDTGNRITGIVPYAVALGNYVTATSDISIIEVPHPSGGDIIHHGSAFTITVGANEQTYYKNVIDYLCRAVTAPALGLIDSTAAPIYIGAAAIGTALIQDAAITTAKIGTAQITTALIADANITTAKIANLAVGSAQIADLAVITAKIADLGVTTAKINDLSVSTAKIGNLAVTNAKINDLAVDKLTAGTLTAGVINAGNIRSATTVDSTHAGWFSDGTSIRAYDGSGHNYQQDVGFQGGSGAGITVEITNTGQAFFSGTVSASAVYASVVATSPNMGTTGAGAGFKLGNSAAVPYLDFYTVGTVTAGTRFYYAPDNSTPFNPAGVLAAGTMTFAKGAADSDTETISTVGTPIIADALAIASFKPNTTIALRGALGTFTSTPGGSITPAFGQATASGNLLIAWVAANTTAASNITTAASGWTKAVAANATVVSGNIQEVDIWYKANCGASETAPTFTATLVSPSAADSEVETITTSASVNVANVNNMVMASFKPNTQSTPIALVGSLGAFTTGNSNQVSPTFGQATTGGNLLTAWVSGHIGTTGGGTANLGATAAATYSYDYSGVNSDNMVFMGPFTMPQHGTITQLSVYMTGDNGSGSLQNVDVNLCLWDGSGTLIAYGSTVTYGGGLSLRTQSITSTDAPNGSSWFIGFWRPASQGARWGVKNGGSFKFRTNVGLGSCAGYSNCSGAYVCGDMQAYAQYTIVSPGTDITTTASGWTKAKQALNNGSTTFEETQLWYKANCGASEAAPVFTSSYGTEVMYAQLAEWSGVVTTSPLDKTGSILQGAASTSMTVPNSAADAQSGNLVLTASRWILASAATASFAESSVVNFTATQAGSSGSQSVVQHANFEYGIVPVPTMHAQLAEFSGALTASPLDRTGTGNQTSAATALIATATLADAANNDLIVTAGRWQQTANSTASWADSYNNASGVAAGSSGASSLSQHSNFAYGIITGSTTGTVLQLTTFVGLEAINEAQTSSGRGFISTAYSTDNFGSSFIGRKARGTKASPLTIANGDEILSHWAQAYDGTNWYNTGRTRYVVNGTVSAGNIPTDFEIRLNPGTGEFVAATFKSDGSMVLGNPGMTGVWTKYRARALMSANQSVAQTTTVKVVFDTVDYDLNSNYDTTNRRYTAPVTGYYLVTFTVNNSPGSQTGYLQAWLRKNGSDLGGGGAGYSTVSTNSWDVGTSGTKIIHLTAADYLEVWFRMTSNVGGTTIIGGTGGNDSSDWAIAFMGT